MFNVCCPMCNGLGELTHWLKAPLENPQLGAGFFKSFSQWVS
jgi:hypothetical protein